MGKWRLTILGKVKQVLQTPTFKKAVKKLHQNQKADLDKAIRRLMKNPQLGQQKKGDLDFLRVYKFKMVKELTLLAYIYDQYNSTIELLVLGTHQNFYRDSKKLF